MTSGEDEKGPQKIQALATYSGTLSQITQNPLLDILGKNTLTEDDIAHIASDTLGMEEQYQVPRVIEFFRKTRFYMALEMERRQEAEGIEDPFTQLNELLVTALGSFEISALDNKGEGKYNPNIESLIAAQKALQAEKGEMRKTVLNHFHLWWWEGKLKWEKKWENREENYHSAIENILRWRAKIPDGEQENPASTYLHIQLEEGHVESCAPIMKALGLQNVVKEINSMKLAWNQEAPQIANIPIQGISGVFGKASDIRGRSLLYYHSHSMSFGVTFNRDAIRRALISHPLFEPCPEI